MPTWNTLVSDAATPDGVHTRGETPLASRKKWSAKLRLRHEIPNQEYSGKVFCNYWSLVETYDEETAQLAREQGMPVCCKVTSLSHTFEMALYSAKLHDLIEV